MTQKKTILVLASTYPRWYGDPEPGFIHELCKRLTAQYNVIAIVPDAPDADPNGVFEGVEVIRYQYAPKRLQTLVNNGGITVNLKQFWWKWFLVPGFLFCQYMAIRGLLRQRKVDVIHAHWLLPQGWIARYFAKNFKIPYLVTSHGGDLYGLRGHFLTWMKRQVVESCAAMTVVSQAMKSELSQIGLHPRQLRVIPMGVDLQSRFVPSPSRVRDCDELLFVGRLVPKKGLTYLLDAMPIILENRPTTRLVIVGFGPEEEALKAQVTRLGLSQSVTFSGAVSQSDLPEKYHRASLFVAPFVRAENGDQEGLPVALMEAIGCCCPAIVGHVAGLDDLLGDTIAEISVLPQDTNALAQAILSALADPDNATQRARLIRERAIELVDWQSVSFAYAELLELCIASSE